MERKFDVEDDNDDIYIDGNVDNGQTGDNDEDEVFVYRYYCFVFVKAYLKQI